MLKCLKKSKRSVKFAALSLMTTIAITTTANAFTLDNLIDPILQTQSIASVAAGQVSISGTSTNPDIAGTLFFFETPMGLHISGSFVNVPPGEHGFHIHEGGSCAEDGSAAGGHFNPHNVGHGHVASQGFEAAHAGDLGNLVADANGNAYIEETIPGLTITDGFYSIAGRAVILHAQADDFSQPTGNAGARIACGVIAPTFAMSQATH